MCCSFSRTSAVYSTLPLVSFCDIDVALWDKVIPGMLDQFDCPSMICLFAGRPLLILNGDLDPNCPLGGAKLAFAAAVDRITQNRTAERRAVDADLVRAPGAR